MAPVEAFTLLPIAEPGSDGPERFRLAYRGTPLPPILEGRRLEGQFATGDGRHLLFVTDDTPYEERLQLLLLGPSFEVQDAIELGAPYVSGFLTHVEARGEDRVAFTFEPQGRYEVVVLAEPRWLPPGRPPPNVRRPGPPFRRRSLDLVRLGSSDA